MKFNFFTFHAYCSMDIISGMEEDETAKSTQDGWSDIQISDFQEFEHADDLDSLNLDDDERTQLMIENERLYSQSLQVDNDIQKVEKQMAELHQLQETFAEKVSRIYFLTWPLMFLFLVANLIQF